MPKRISVDIDGVISHFTGQVAEIAERLWPGKLPADYEPPDWYWTDVFSKKDWDAVWDVIHNTYNFWGTASPYQRNLDDLRDFLYTSPTEVFFVTSRAVTAGSTVAMQTFNWMRDKGLPVAERGINYSAIVPVPDSKKKRQVIEGLEIKYSVDDLGPTVEMCNQIPGHTAYVLDRPWNRDKEYGPRVFSLQEFFDKVEAN